MTKPNLKYTNIIIAEKNIKKPETFKEVAEDSHLKKAIKEEIIALKQNQTWDLIPKPKDTKLISCKWVCQIKKCPDGSVEKIQCSIGSLRILIRIPSRL